jgi:hypothetical protein
MPSLGHLEQRRQYQERGVSSVEAEREVIRVRSLKGIGLIISAPQMMLLMSLRQMREHMVTNSPTVLSIVVGDSIRSVNFYSPMSRRLAIGCSDSLKGKEGDVLCVFEEGGKS